MSIQQPRRFVTTDQGHADVLNVPIDTLYTNDQELAAQIESIKKDPAGNGVASKKALDDHVADKDLHVTAAKQAGWNAAQANAKAYTEQYAAPKSHTHSTSDLPSATTQARGITQLNNSVSSIATDQAATPSAVKAAYDLAVSGQRVKVTADDGSAQNISGQDLNVDRPTGWYMGSSMGNAPNGEWYWVENIKHNTDWFIQVAYNFNNVDVYSRYKRGGAWSGWTWNPTRAEVDYLKSVARNMIVSPATPSGGNDGDIWFQYQ
ncbi:pyocin knob domain-containing protein [Paenibacillus peoriae]|uniref:pyocin knob domain-containing protein n=1 Tax=Paenibacillus peoriae TaxID=59893 RepID=UPI00026C5FA2|nr:pyocin knob domain-containing protein [Paenibacillus peoriae]MEC0180225.1 pyocin knob domain-containing protein [Paenibacillus peoriae]